MTTTDRRLMTILRGGEDLKRAVDPDRLLGAFRADGLSYLTTDRQWSLRLHCFREGTLLRLKGIFQKRYALITAMEMLTPGKQWEAVRIRREKTVARAIGNLSEAPAALKRSLTPCAGGNGAPGEFNIRELISTARSALLWGVEKDKGLDVTQLFILHKFMYEYNDEGSPVLADFAAMCSQHGGTITIRTEADVLGLRNKRVVLDRHAGFQHYVSVYCTTKENGNTRPSLKTAVALNARFPELFSGGPAESRRI